VTHDQVPVFSQHAVALHGRSSHSLSFLLSLSEDQTAPLFEAVGDGGRSAVTVQQRFERRCSRTGARTPPRHTLALRHGMLCMRMRSCRRAVQVEGVLRGSEVSNSGSDSPEGMWLGTGGRARAHLNEVGAQLDGLRPVLAGLLWQLAYACGAARRVDIRV